MDDRTTRILCLQIILNGKCLKNLICVVDRQMRRVCIERLRAARNLRLVRNNDIWITFLVFKREPIRRSLRGCRLKVVEITGFLLVQNEACAHTSKHLFRKRTTFFRANIRAEKIYQRLIHADNPYGRKVILPIFAVRRINFTQVEGGIRIQVCAGKPLNYFPLYLQALFRNIHEAIKPLKELFLALCDVSYPWHIDGYHTYGTGKRIRPKKTATTSLKFVKVKTQSTTHGTSILRFHVRVNEI